MMMTMMFLFCCSLLFTVTAFDEYTFALIPKSTSNPFFTLVKEGCDSRANVLSSSSPSTMNITCLFIGPYNESAAEQVTIIDDLISGIKYGPVDGISVSVGDAITLTPAINRAVEAGIPVITFDSDAVGSKRESYVGTNNLAFGQELGKLLHQLSPVGGTYGAIAASAPNVVERYDGVTKILAEGGRWIPIQDSYLDCKDDIALALELMKDFATMGVQAIIPVGGWPMWNKEPWIDFVNTNTNITLIVGDALDVQMELMNMGYVDGLVGQLPFEMGTDSINVLLNLVKNEDVGIINYGTSILEVLRFPLVLPPVNDGKGVNNNYIGALAILGYLIYALIVASSLFLMVWTHVHKETRVVKASQPFFLQMIIGGILIFSSAIIPLSIDDQKNSQKSCDMACMATPWLLTIGFTTTFSALFAKTWRVNKIFHNPNAFKRIKVTEKDVIQPYLIMMGINLIVLICWTVISPLKYKRSNWPGTDLWNRIIATYGSCQEEEENSLDFWPYLSIILFVNIGILIVANVQSYQARLIQTEYSESHYITIIMASLAQMFLLAVPCVILLSQQPRPYYVVMVIVILCVSAAVLGLMFVPKIFATRIWLKEKAAKEEKKAAMRASVISRPASSFSDSGGTGLKIAIMPKKSQIWKGFTMSRINDPPPPVGNESIEEKSGVSVNSDNDGLKFMDMSGQNLNYVPEKEDVVAPSQEITSSTSRSNVSFKDSVTSETEEDDNDGLKFMDMSGANLNYVPEKEDVVAPSQEVSHTSSTRRRSSVRFQDDAIEEEKDESSCDANSIPESVLYGEVDDIQSLEQALDVIKTLRRRLTVD